MGKKKMNAAEMIILSQEEQIENLKLELEMQKRKYAQVNAVRLAAIEQQDKETEEKAKAKASLEDARKKEFHNLYNEWFAKTDKAMRELKTHSSLCLNPARLNGDMLSKVFDLKGPCAVCACKSLCETVLEKAPVFKGTTVRKRQANGGSEKKRLGPREDSAPITYYGYDYQVIPLQNKGSVPYGNPLRSYVSVSYRGEHSPKYPLTGVSTAEIRKTLRDYASRWGLRTGQIAACSKVLAV